MIGHFVHGKVTEQDGEEQQGSERVQLVDLVGDMRAGDTYCLSGAMRADSTPSRE